MRLALGTAQFGLDYGATNRRGRPDERELRSILAVAREGGIDMLDTAHLYGDAEAAIGRCLPAGYRPRIVTKTPSFAGRGAGAAEAAALVAAAERSLSLLRCDRLHALLLHDPADLAAPGADRLAAALREAVRRGLAERAGVSLYRARELEAALRLFDPALVQVPVSVLDQRLSGSGALERLGKAGVEIHARSVFLQGVLLHPVAALPAFFAPIRAHLARLEAAAASLGVSKAAACLGFVRRHPEISYAVVGVAAADELAELLDSDRAARGLALPYAELGAGDLAILDPSTWPPRATLMVT